MGGGEEGILRLTLKDGYQFIRRNHHSFQIDKLYVISFSLKKTKKGPKMLISINHVGVSKHL